MFKRLKKLFQKEEPVIENIDPDKIQEWFLKYSMSLEFASYYETYRRDIQEILTILQTQSDNLRNAVISSDHKNVQVRVKNIVTGHKEKYADEVSWFAQRVEIPEMTFTNLQSYQKAIDVNATFVTKLDDLARRTNKSYQAAQHLFFEPVEKIFATLRDADKITKQFKQEIVTRKIDNLPEVQKVITDLEEMRKSEKRLQKEVVELEEEKQGLQKLCADKQEELKTIQTSEEYTALQQRKQEKETILQEKRENEQHIFSFFAKLQKPLKKYQRIALDDSRITKYLDDPIGALHDDENIEIVADLMKVMKNLPTLKFDQKQREKFSGLIAKAESGHLKTLQEKAYDVQAKERKITEQIGVSTIENEVKTCEHKIQQDRTKIAQREERLTANTKARAKIDEKTQLEKIKTTIQDVLGKTISFSSS